MTHHRWALRLGLALGVVLGGEAVAQAQDDAMDFGTPEGGDATGAEGTGEGEEAMEFSTEDVESALPQGGFKVTAVILRTDPSIDAQDVVSMTDALMLELDKLKGYQVLPNQDLQDRFATMGDEGALDCAFNPICLGRVGQEAGLQKMLVGRVSGGPGDWTINLDLVNVEDSAIEDYTSRTVKGDLDDLREVFQPSVRKLFNIRQNTGKPKVEAPPPEIGPVQKTLAWTTLGTSALCLGLGVWFGLDASSIQSELEDGERVTVGGQNVYRISPQAANARFGEAEDSALFSNIFYGIGLASGVTSALLFFITPGSDIATEEELNSGLPDLRLTPMVGADGGGVSAGFSW